MGFDLAIATNGDLILTGHRDLAGISGNALLEQRIRIRLQTPRGSWLYDRNKTFGSLVHQYMQSHPDRAYALPTVIQEALAPMEDITVHNVEIIDVEKMVDGAEHHGSSPGVRVYYSPAEETGILVEQSQFSVDVPLVIGAH